MIAMAAEAHAIPVADLRQNDSTNPAPALGAQLATRLAEACADYGLKSHLGLPEVLGREPTSDEAAIHDAALEARDAALEAFASWAPQNWEEFADKSEALDRANAVSCFSPGAEQDALLADLRRLALTPAVGVVESAIPVWVRERERRRFHATRMTAEDDDPCSELFVEANALILRAPCSSLQSVSEKLKALTDKQIGLQHGPGAHDLSCLQQIIGFLDLGRAETAGVYRSRALLNVSALTLENVVPEALDTLAPRRPSLEQLRLTLVAAWEDMDRKRHLGDDVVLRRAPTDDEEAIYSAASAAIDAAVAAVTAWKPETWLELAQKSQLLEHPAAEDDPHMRLDTLRALQADIRRLASIYVEDAAQLDFRAWELERERNRPPLPANATDEEDLAKLDRMTDANDHILRTPCRSIATAAIKLRAVLDPEIGLFSCGDSLLDEPALRQLLAVLEREPSTGSAAAESRLAPVFVEALELSEQAGEMGWDEEGEVALGDPSREKAGELLDGVHLAACTSRADALVKLGVLQADFDLIDDLEAVRAVVTASITSIRLWLLGLPPNVETDDVLTRAKFQAARQAEAAAVPRPDPRADMDLIRAEKILLAYVQGDLVYRNEACLNGTAS